MRSLKASEKQINEFEKTKEIMSKENAPKAGM